MAFRNRIASLLKGNESLRYYLYECQLSPWNEADFRPQIRNFTLKIVTSENELDDLVGAGFDLSPDSPVTRAGLRKGAIAFMLFVGRELASKELIATNSEAKSAIDKYPYKVDFANREACAAEVW